MSRKLYFQQRYQKNKESEKAKAKIRRLENPEARRSWLQLNGHKPKVRFDKAKSKRRKYGWSLTIEYYTSLISSPCHYCGCDISKDTGSGLDRLDHKKGYEPGNVVPACAPCNISRNVNFTPEEWKIGIQAIMKFRSQST